MELAMHNNATAIQDGHRLPLAETSSVRRSIVLRSTNDGQAATRPAKDEKRKRVWFDPPRPVVCTLDSGATLADCVVLGIWETGARLRVQDARLLKEFDLHFALGPRPVMRRCKRLLVQGDVMDVQFQLRSPRQ